MVCLPTFVSLSLVVITARDFIAQGRAEGVYGQAMGKISDVGNTLRGMNKANTKPDHVPRLAQCI